MSTKSTCKGCIHLINNETSTLDNSGQWEKKFECRRFPPSQQGRHVDGEEYSYYPRVSKDFPKCGEKVLCTQ